MKKKLGTVVFFGSGPVAAKSLELLEHNFNIEAVITKPKPAHHKGSFPVLEVSEKLRLPVITAATKKELSDVIARQHFQSQLAVLIDFGIIVTQDVIDKFPLGIVNSHFSLLPEWRGADPITFAILSGQKQTGISLMLLVEAMDEGPLLAQTPIELTGGVDEPTLTKELIEISDKTLTQILPLYMNGQISPAPQEYVTMAGSKVPTYSRKLAKEDGIIDWQKPAEVIEREIRGFIGWPKSRTTLANQDVIVTAAHVEGGNGQPGKIYVQDKKLSVYTAKDILVIDRLKPAGKSEMTATAFLAGYGNKLGA